ncbi:MAG TPA: hypothetical protein VF109_02060 [Mycobacteriales bacterium]
MTRAARRAGGPGGSGPFTTGDRLPVPTRQRRPMLAVLAVVLILGGAAIAATLVLTSGQKQQYLLINRDVAIGQTLTAEDFLQQPLAATNSAVFAPVPVSDFATRVRGTKALVPLRKGALLTEGTFGPAVTPPKGLTDVSVSVPEGGYPVGLAAGDVVKVIYTPRNTSDGGGSVPTAAPRGLIRGATLIGSAYVTVVQDNTAGQGGKIVALEVRNEDLELPRQAGLPALAWTNAVNSVTVVRLDPTVTYDKGD